jgi:hypothetical protein
MESKEEWDGRAQRCPGMNDGRFYAAEEIQKLLTLNPFEDL